MNTTNSTSEAFESTKSGSGFFVLVLAFSMFFTTLALVTSLAFRAQRRFPIILVPFCAVLDLIFQVYEAGSMSAASITYERDHPSQSCTISLYVPIFVGSGIMVLNTLLAFSIYNLIKKSQNMSYSRNPQYAWIFGGIFLVWQTFFPTMAITFGCPDRQCKCGALPLPIAVSCLLAPFIFCVMIQMGFLGTTLHHVWVTSSHSNARLGKEGKRAKKNLLLYIRLVSIVLVQVIQWLFFYLWISGFNLGKAPEGTSQDSFNAYVSAGAVGIGYIVGPVIVIASNRSFKGWLRSVICNHTHIDTSDINHEPSRKSIEM